MTSHSNPNILNTKLFMITDPVGDLFTRIRNIVTAGKTEVAVPYSRIKFEISQVLKEEGYVSEVKKVKNMLIVNLATSHRKPVISGVRNISKPGLRIYRKADKVPQPLRGAGISIVSTPQGVMSGRQAKKKNLGGEILGEVW